MVTDGGDVLDQGFEARRARERRLIERVGGVLVVEVHGEVVAVDEREVETDVKLLRRFPRQLRVGDLLRCDTSHRVVVVVRSVVTASGIPVDVLITHRTIRHAQHGVRDGAVILQELLAREAPLTAHRPEVTPAMVRSEDRRTVAAEGQRSVVLIGIGVMSVHEVRSQSGLAQLSLLILPLSGCGQLTLANGREGEVRTRQVGVGIVLALRLLTEQEVEVMISQRLVPSADVGPGNDRCARGVLRSGAVPFPSVGVIDGAVIAILVEVVDVHAQRSLHVEATAEVHLQIRAEIDHLRLRAVDVTQLGVVYGQRIHLVDVRVVPVCIARRVERFHERNGSHEWAAHCAVGALIEAILDGIGERGVGAHSEAFELAIHVQSAGKAREVGVDHDTLCVHISEAEVIARLAGAAGDVQVVVLIVARTSNEVEPVGGRRAVPTIVLRQGLIGRIVVGSATSSHPSLGVEIHGRLGVGVVHIVVTHRDSTLLHLKVDRRSALSALLGGDDDHTVTGARAIDGRCGSVLKDGDVLDVRRVQRRHRVHVVVARGGATLVLSIHRHTVDHIQRGRTRVERSAAAHKDASERSGHTRGVVHLHAWHSALERLHKAGVGLLIQGLLVHNGGGAGERGAALGGVTGDYDLVEQLIVALEADRQAGRYGHLLRLEADIRDD